MSNITEQNRIVIRKGSDRSLERGYGLVVYEKGTYQFFPDGKKPKEKGAVASFFQGDEAEVYAVANSTNHVLHLTKSIAHSDGVHHFKSNITVNFSVINPTELIRTLGQDPVKRIKGDVGHVMVSFLKDSSWEDIKDPLRFKTLRSQALEAFVATGRNEAMPLFDRINENASRFGLSVDELNFEVVLSEKDLQVEIKEDEKTKEKQISNLETDANLHKNSNVQREEIQKKQFTGELNSYDRSETLKDQVTTTAGAFIDKTGKNIADGTRSMKGLIEVLRGANEIQQEVLSNNISGIARGGGEGGNAKLLSSSEQNLVNSLQEILAKTKREELGKKTEKRLLGTLFHLIAGKLLDESDEVLQEYLNLLQGVELSGDFTEYLMASWKEIKHRIEDDNIL